MSHTIKHLRFLLAAQAPMVAKAGKECYLEISTMAAASNIMQTGTVEVQPGFNADALATLIYEMLANNLPQQFNIFVGVNLRKVAVSKHARKTDVCEETCLLKLDIDNLSKEQLPGIISKLPAQASLVVWSGHGAHLYFALSAPVPVEMVEVIERELSKLINGDPSVSNRNRLLRLAGSYNWKDTSNPIPVVILDEFSSNSVYDSSVFSPFSCDPGIGSEELIQTIPEVSSEQVAVIAQAIASNPEFLQLEEQVSGLSARLQSIVFQATDPKNPSKADRSSLLQSAVTGMVAAGWMDELIAQVLSCNSFSISSRLQEESKKGRGAAEYLAQSISKARDYVAKNNKTRKSNGTQPSTGANTLVENITAVIQNANKNSEDYHEPCAQIVIDSLTQCGEFIYAPDSLDSYNAIAPRDKCYYRDNLYRIIPIASEEFDTLLMLKYGLPSLYNAHKSIRNYVVNQIATNYQNYPKVEFANIGQYRNDSIYITQGQGRICKITANSITTIHNGDEGTFFHDELRPWEYVPNHTENYLNDLFKLSIDSNAPYSEEQATLAVKTWFIANFMRGNHMVNHYAILNLIGDKGSGKTTLGENMVRILIGDAGYTASNRPREERDFSAAIKNQGIVIFDNVEGFNYNWAFEDALARVYQRGTYTERKLYTNNTKIQYKTNAFLILTAIKPGWGRSDIATRSIVLELASWAKQKGTAEQTQQQHLTHLICKRNEILTEVMNSLQRLLQHLQSHNLEEYRINHRLESYAMAVNAWCVANQVASMEELEVMWNNLQNAQEDLVNQDTLVIDLMEKFVNEIILDKQSPLQYIVKSIEFNPRKLLTNQFAIKGSDLFGYMIRTYEIADKVYKSDRQFTSAIMNHTSTLEKIGIVITQERSNTGRYLLINYREYVNQNAEPRGIISVVPNDVIEAKQKMKSKKLLKKRIEQAATKNDVAEETIKEETIGESYS